MDITSMIQTALAAIFVLAVVPAAVEYAREKTKGTKVEKAVGIVLDAVDQTNQTFADQFRQNGTFTEDKQKEALRKSLKTSLSMMNDKTIEFLEKEFNDVEAWITSKIEAACKENNRQSNNS